ncbi:MAG: hypothetical protein OXC03_04025 [Flavobacteriaceae bacterium]|nr:hypothetical protein [Flavobacteriaceae bacterium]
MTTSNRLILYGFGFFIGLIVLLFIWDKKDAQFNYTPQARVKRSLLSKNEIRQSVSKEKFTNDSIVRFLIEHGKVVFSKSITNRDSCNLYHIKYKSEAFIEIENCPSYIHLTESNGLQIFRLD